VFIGWGKTDGVLGKWALKERRSRTVLRGGAAGNGGSLLDHDTPDGKQPYYFTRRDGQVMTIAGLWSNWNDKATGEDLKSCTMVIIESNRFVAEVHDRMPDA
jgi:hypothetical protein